MRESESPLGEAKRSPLGEARRLRYFMLISSKLLESPSVDMDLFIERLVKAAKIINPELKNYVRDTGVLQSNAVARNYLRFADWLDFLKLENRIVIPNSYTVFLANLDNWKSFDLTNKEKIVFFMKLIGLEDFKNLLRTLRVDDNAIKDYIALLKSSEHFVESYFEWLVDLGVLKPTRRKFGLFYLSNMGYQISEALRKNEEEVSKKYAEIVIGKSLSNSNQVSDTQVWELLRKAVDKLGRCARSEIDSSLYSAYPLILELQINLVFEYQTMVSELDLVKKLKEMAPNYNALFSWDNMSNAGYLKFVR
jgi:hypothetical protein